MTAADINAVGRTSLAVAALRAEETRRADALISDPYAESLLAAAGGAPPYPGDPSAFHAIMADQVAVRTRFLDEALLGAGCRQIVLVASGMDSRAQRLAWPDGTTVFELDQPTVLEFKNRVLPTPARCALHTVGVDLLGDWPAALTAAGFRPDEPTAWLVEGMLYALDEPSATALLATIGGLSAQGSRVAFDHVERSTALRDALTALDPELVGLWRGGPADPAVWLAAQGWRPDVRELADVAAPLGRATHPAYDPATPGHAHSWLATATRGNDV